MLKPQIALFIKDLALQEKGAWLAQELRLPIVTAPGLEVDYLLILSNEHISLKKTTGNSSALSIDFLTKKLQYRQKQVSFKTETIGRAMGLRPSNRPHIVDATGGLGQDSFVLATLGYHNITVLERSPIIFTLLIDGIQRATPYLKILQHLTFIQTDAIAWLHRPLTPDIVYLDPMFPLQKKTALAGKAMQFFHDIVGDDLDANELFAAALACAVHRVVVKRPRMADFITAKKPCYSLEGRSNRFDIYLK